MKRLAILIGDITPYSDLPGIRPDLQGMYSYLMSPTGGAFRKEEIIVCTTGLWSQVDRALGFAQNCEYCFVYFSGHGSYNVSTGSSLVQFRDSVIPADCLRPDALINLLVLDSCQTYAYRYRPTAPLQGIGDVGYYSFDASLHRRAFDEVLAVSAPGTTVIHGAEEGYAAYDSRFGGHFTQSLLYCAKHMEHLTEEPFLTIDDLLDYTNAFLEVEVGTTQRAVIDEMPSDSIIPFAIHLDEHSAVRKVSRRRKYSWR